MQNTESSLTSFVERWQELREHHWLDLAEYASIGVSAIGSVAAGLSGQVLLAATPITFALTLNVLNRHRIELQTRVQNTATIAEMNQIVDSLQIAVQSLPPSHRFEDLEGSVIRISETVANIEEFLEKTSPQIGPMDTMTIQKEFAVLRRAIMRLRDHTESTLDNVQQSMNTDFSALRQAIANVKHDRNVAVPTLEIQTEVAKQTQGLTEDIQTEVAKQTQGLTAEIQSEVAKQAQGLTAEIQSEVAKQTQGLTEDIQTEFAKHTQGFSEEIHSEIAKQTQEFSDLQTQIQTITNHPSALISGIEPLQEQILQLQEQVCQLQQQNQEIVKPYLKRLTRAVKHLNQQPIHSNN